MGPHEENDAQMLNFISLSIGPLSLGSLQCKILSSSSVGMVTLITLFIITGCTLVFKQKTTLNVGSVLNTSPVGKGNMKSVSVHLGYGISGSKPAAVGS